MGEFFTRLDSDTVAGFLNELGWWAFAASIFLNVVISVLAFVPSFFLSGANAIVFGFPMGFAISLIGETLGAYISYVLYEKGLSKIKDHRPLGNWGNAFVRGGPWKQFLLLLLARISPFLPSGAVTLLAAWTRMNVVLFLIATVIGKAPSIAMEIWAGISIFDWLFNNM